MSSSAPVKGTKAVQSVLGRGREAGSCVVAANDLLEEAVLMRSTMSVMPASLTASWGRRCLQGQPNMRSRAPPCLGRVGRDQLDGAELRQGAADLGRGVLVHLESRPRIVIEFHDQWLARSA